MVKGARSSDSANPGGGARKGTHLRGSRCDPGALLPRDLSSPKRSDAARSRSTSRHHWPLEGESINGDSEHDIQGDRVAGNARKAHENSGPSPLFRQLEANLATSSRAKPATSGAKICAYASTKEVGALCAVSRDPADGLGGRQSCRATRFQLCDQWPPARSYITRARGIVKMRSEANLG